MKSFRLDRDSVDEVRDRWPVLLVGLTIALAFGYFGWASLWCRVAMVLSCGLLTGFLLRGSMTRRLRATYPGARNVPLLTIGLATMTYGAAARLLFRTMQGSPLDLAWLAVSFLCILVFVLRNRGVKGVMD